MPQKVKITVDGQEVEQEVFTQAELDEQSTARATEAAQTAREEAGVEAQAKIDELNAELEKEKAKEKNFKALRDSKGGPVPEELTKKIEDISKELAELKQQPIKSVVGNFKKNNYGEDKDLNTKFDHYFDKLGKDAKTEEEILKAATDAHALVSGGQKPNTDYKMTGTRVSGDFRKPQEGQESDASKSFGQAFGLSEADKKKYGKK